MRTGTIFAGVALMFAGSLAYADDSAKLIELDKEWGSTDGSAAVERLVASDALVVGEKGLVTQAEMIAAAATDEPMTGPYVAGDYQVRFLSADVAVMVHSADTPASHWSMHVWHKTDGKWQVAASATVPQAE
ncbi:MAG: nuclear transport factor 2 family protein [Gammaproteobacteria bacterium]|nr:nuclear transport factor 2 family protein [Gammaproteobacteria bacterium]